MASVRGSRAGRLAVAVLLVGAAVAGSGVASAGPASVEAPAGAEGPTSVESLAEWRPSADVADTGTATKGAHSTATAESVSGGAGRDRSFATDPPASSRATVSERGGTASVTGTATAVANHSRTIVATQRLRLTPDDPGTVAVTLEYAVPDTVTSLRTAVLPNATVTDTTGFTRQNETTYEWDGETGSASVTYSIDVNESDDVAGPEGGPGEYLFADVGEWALFRRPPVATTWRWRGPEPVGLDRATALAGPGVAGEWIVYMGETRVVERRAHGQRFRLVVPERATLAQSPDAILTALSTAADQLRVGDRDETVVAFAAPTTSVEWGVRGLQYGERDMWVRDLEPLDTVENTWIHEYVHTRQDYERTVATEWTVEALATYYAALLTVEQDRAPLGGLGPYLGRGTLPPQGSSVLSAPETWRAGANYWKGALVVGDLDRRIRERTDSEQSLQRVFSTLNAHRGNVTGDDLAAAVGEVVDEGVRDLFVAYATTSRAPEIWSRATHERVFDATPARVSVGFADQPPPFSVSGPFRNETVAPDADPAGEDAPMLTLFAGETLGVRATGTNAGGATTRYEIPFAVGDAVVANASGSVAPGESVGASFERAFPEPGEFALAVGSDEVTVRVYDPGPVAVTDLRTNRTALDAPGAVAVSVTVANNYSVPARGPVALSVGNRTVLNRTVALAPGAERGVETTARLERNGTYVLTAGRANLNVTVGRENTGGTADSGGVGPGFGVGVAVVAILAGVGWFQRRRR